MKSGANHHPKIDELADAPGKDFKGGWGKLPQKWFADGFLPKLNLKRNQLYVLLVIVAHLDGRTHTCGTLSTGDIAVRADIRSRRTVHAAIKNLTAKKLITIEQRHGRGNHNIFRISESAQVPGHNCSLQAVKCANSPRNTRRKCANPGGHQGESEQNTRLNCAPIQSNTEGSSRRRCAAAGCAPNEEPSPLRVALAAAGIGEPNISELASSPHLTPTIVRQEKERARASGKQNGVVVNDLRTRHEAMTAQAATKSQRQATQAQEAEQQQVGREQEDQERAARLARYEALTSDEIAEYRRAILSDMSPGQRKHLRPDGPTMQAFIIERLSQ